MTPRTELIFIKCFLSLSLTEGLTLFKAYSICEELTTMGTSDLISPEIRCFSAMRLDSRNNECKSAPLKPSSLESFATDFKSTSEESGGFVPFCKNLFHYFSRDSNWFINKFRNEMRHK